MASSRIQRWLTLIAYQYSIKYKAGKSLNNADALSRLPQADISSDNGLPGDIIQLINHLCYQLFSHSQMDQQRSSSLKTQTVCLARISNNQTG